MTKKVSLSSMVWLLASHALGVVGEDRRQDLQSNLTTGFRVGGAIDLSHAARTELGGGAIMRNALANHRNVPESMGLS